MHRQGPFVVKPSILDLVMVSRVWRGMRTGFVANGAGNGRDATGGDLPRLARTVTALDLVLMVLASLNEAEADAEDVA
ncbi:hypothetical protein CYMTET_39519 [Cymbomonas tetramitiformis]|uniref:Uncharacterized protein n=1 Tax=Cymbomonas tetramitiformis TaxID=36881 RepID=A0AAE0CBA1_9CHLO|nr:hypothetical protein CYMTET_39519 [Cymbomonas tetramitiformis]